MPKCPQCQKNLVALPRKCPSCQADLDLLVEYGNQLQAGLEHADRLCKNGELGKAVWAYLAILEIDPDNATARQQVGTVATAVRIFDKTAPSKRWLDKLRQDDTPAWLFWLKAGLIFAGVLLAFALGLGVGLTPWPDLDSPTTDKASSGKQKESLRLNNPKGLK